MQQYKKIAIIGLGYVGLPLAVEFGKTRPTLGFDINVSRVKELEQGTDSTLEVFESDLAQATHLKYTCKVDDLSDCEIFIVTVPGSMPRSATPRVRGELWLPQAMQFLNTAISFCAHVKKKGSRAIWVDLATGLRSGSRART